MLVVVSFVIIFLSVVTIIGQPINRLLAGPKVASHFSPFLTQASINLILGFSIIAFSASISYSFLGIDLFPIVVILLSLFSPVILLLKHVKFELPRITFSLSNLAILVPILFSIYLSRSQWSSITRPQIHAGNGPDVSQNLMAALSARDLGGTWKEQGKSLRNFLDVDTLREAVQGVFTIPSFRDQAGFDYLVFGTRWSLTIFYSQVLRFFGDGAILWETGFVLLFSLISTAILSFGTISLLTTATKWRVIGSLICVGNTSFLSQFFNGGLSQAFATVGVLGIFLGLTAILTVEIQTKFTKVIIFSVITASWIILLTTYVDAAFIIVLFILILFMLSVFVNRETAEKIVYFFLPSGLLSLILNPILSYSTFTILDLRGRSAITTGIKNPIWAYPSELFGFGGDSISLNSSRQVYIVIFGIILSAGILYFALYKFRLSVYSLVLVSGFLTLLIGFMVSSFVSNNNYIYHKVGVYLAPGILIFIFGKVLDLCKLKINIGNFNFQSISFPILISLTLISTINSIHISTRLEDQGSTISYEMKQLLDSAELQARLSNYNYLAPYVLSGNYLGVLANIHWVSKSPNDLDLKNRAFKELRLICFEGDPNCKPTTAQISDPAIEKFGLIQYESPLSSFEFKGLDVRSRYKINFKVFGMKEMVIPEKFLGGNPYLK